MGKSYILVDWHTCDACDRCVDACDRDAIRRAVVPERSGAVRANVAVSDVPKVVVGSRAEAKAVRKAAEGAAKQRAKTVNSAVRHEFVMRGTAKAAAKAAEVAGESCPIGPGTWGLVDVAIVLGVLLLALVLKSRVLALPAIGLMPTVGRSLTRAAVLVAYYGIQFGALALLANRHGLKFDEAFGLARESDPAGAEVSAVGSAGLVLALFLGTEGVSTIYGLTVQAIGWTQPDRLSSDLSGVFGYGPLGLALSVLLVAVAAPVAEEIAFRGVVLPVSGERWGMWPGIVVSAAIYALYHFNAWLFLPTFVLGLALGWLAWTRRSLWPPIALHVLYNGVAVLAGLLLTR